LPPGFAPADHATIEQSRSRHGKKKQTGVHRSKSEIVGARPTKRKPTAEEVLVAEMLALRQCGFL
jgi:hypothetical protein